MTEHTDSDKTSAAKKHNKVFAKTLLTTISSIIVAAAVIILICSFILPVFKVTGDSMTPLLSKGDIILCNKNTEIKKGDVIAFYHNRKVLIKRVIASSNDVINLLDDGTVELNGQKLNETYVSEKAVGQTDITYPFTVPESRFFVMGDKRDTSVDSRSTAVGCIAEENIIGKVYLKILPLDSFGKIK